MPLNITNIDTPTVKLFQPAQKTHSSDMNKVPSGTNSNDGGTSSSASLWRKPASRAQSHINNSASHGATWRNGISDEIKALQEKRRHRISMLSDPLKNKDSAKSSDVETLCKICAEDKELKFINAKIRWLEHVQRSQTRHDDLRRASPFSTPGRNLEKFAHQGIDLTKPMASTIKPQTPFSPEAAPFGLRTKIERTKALVEEERTRLIEKIQSQQLEAAKSTLQPNPSASTVATTVTSSPEVSTSTTTLTNDDTIDNWPYLPIQAPSPNPFLQTPPSWVRSHKLCNPFPPKPPTSYPTQATATATTTTAGKTTLTTLPLPDSHSAESQKTQSQPQPKQGLTHAEPNTDGTAAAVAAGVAQLQKQHHDQEDQSSQHQNRKNESKPHLPLVHSDRGVGDFYDINIGSLGSDGAEGGDGEYVFVDQHDEITIVKLADDAPKKPGVEEEEIDELVVLDHDEADEVEFSGLRIHG